jgi:hypothetical protein
MVQPEASSSNNITDFTFFTTDKTPGLSSDSLNFIADTLNDCYIELVSLSINTYHKENLPANGEFNIIDGSYIKKAAGKKAVFMTIDQCRNILNQKSKNKGNNRAASIVWCDYIVDMVEFKQEISEVFTPQKIQLNEVIFKKNIDSFKSCQIGKFSIVSLKWHASHWYDFSSTPAEWKQIRSASDPGWAFREWHQLTNENDIKAHIKFIDYQTIELNFPATKDTFPGRILKMDDTLQFIDNGHVIGLSIEIKAIGSTIGYNGAAVHGDIFMNTHAGNVHQIGMSRTLLHELAHNMGQVYADKKIDATFGRPPLKEIPGIPFPAGVPEGYAYGGRGHTGTHCAYGLSKSVRSVPNYGNSDDAFLMKQCIMFGSGDMSSSVLFDFCPDCKKHLKAEDISDIRKSWR